MLHCSTSPYFSNKRVTSSSVREGWMPVTKRLEPSLRLSSASRSRGCGGGPLGICQPAVHQYEEERYIPAVAVVTAVGRGTAGARVVVTTLTAR